MSSKFSTPLVVTGAGGLVGRSLQRVLQEETRDYVAVDSARLDLTDSAAVVDFFEATRPAALIHLAGRVRGLLGNIAAPADAFVENLRINTNVIDAAARSGVDRLVAMGSVAMYTDGLPLPMKERDVFTGRPHFSEAPYAHAKRAMLAQLEAYSAQFDLTFSFAVATNMFGPNDRFDEAHGHVVPSLISKFHRAKSMNGDVEVWGSGKARRDFLYSDDASRGLLAMLDRGEGVYNLASGIEVPISYLVEEIARASEFSGSITWDPNKPDGQLERSYDISRLTALDWRPRVSLEEGLRKTYDWFADNRGRARQ